MKIGVITVVSLYPPRHFRKDRKNAKNLSLDSCIKETELVKSTLRVKNQNSIVHLTEKQKLKKKDFKMKLFVYSTAVALMLCSSASASLVIDDFSTGVTINGAGSASGPVNLGTRDITFADVSPSSSVTSGAGVFTATFGNLYGAIDQLTMVYTLSSPVDLHSSGAFPGSPLVLDLFDVVNGTFDLKVTYDGAAGTASTMVAITGAGPIGINGSVFGNGALASAVDKITLVFNATSDVSDGFGGTFSRFSSNSASIAAVPEPTSLALLGASMFGGFGVVARRRKKKLVTEVKA
ncbi:MAG: PEP-CTERM sorting domain-containing protein [Planctomycetaceae bacterium]|nr:PEP-CTERM sorting domain-containing protein [Planctomycetaceae bacterium]